MTIEYTDIINEQDEVIATVTWEEMMQKHLLHRTANVFVLNSQGKILVHRRADNLRLYPGMYDVKVGGSLQAGESYEEAAKRELQEEVGIENAQLTTLFMLRSKKEEDNNVIRKVFKCIHDGLIKIDKSEVAEGRFMSIKEAKELLHNGDLSSSAANVFKEYLKRNS